MLPVPRAHDPTWLPLPVYVSRVLIMPVSMSLVDSLPKQAHGRPYQKAQPFEESGLPPLPGSWPGA